MPPLRFDNEEQARVYLNLDGDLDLTEAEDALDRAEQDDTERKVLWRMLAAYQLLPEYGEFCRKLGFRVSADESRALFDLARTSYVAARKRYGNERLAAMCRIGWNGLYRDNWKLVPQEKP